MPSRQESVEWPEDLRTAMKAPSNKDGKEGRQESARRTPSDQQDIEQSVASKGRSAVRRARLKRLLNNLQVAPISHYRIARVVVRVPMGRESG